MVRFVRIILFWIVLCVVRPGFLTAIYCAADHGHRFEGHVDHDDRHPSDSEFEDDGNEAAGQVAAWLLLAANLPVAVSLMIKGLNRFAPLRNDTMSALNQFNRAQKKVLMWLHYYLNPVILAIALWHWSSSRCRSTVLPEMGLLVMVLMIVLGILMKFNASPRSLRRPVAAVHTQPILFLTMFLVLVAGHLMVD
jgi:hypothetical protein